METTVTHNQIEVSVSKKSFIESFKEYVTSKSDVSPIFQEAVALNLVSLAVSKIPIDTSFESELLPNVWTMLIGYSTYSRKSTLLKQAKLMLPRNANLLSDEFTKEAFFEELSEKHYGLNVWDECAPVLKQLNNNKSYQSGLDDTLMALYNGETRTKALQKGSVTVSNHCFNLLWATTFSNFDKYVTRDTFCTGFGARFLIIFGDDCEKIKLLDGPTSTGSNKKFKEAKANLQEIWDFFHTGNFIKKYRFILSKEAEQIINQWIIEKHAEFVKSEGDEKEFLAAVHGRAEAYLIKLAALYQADAYQLIKLSNGNTIEISKESAQKSIDFMNIVIRMISDKFAKSLSLDWLSKNLATLSKILERCKDRRAERQYLSPRMHLTADKLNTVLATAKDYGMINIYQTKSQVIVLLKTFDETKSAPASKEPFAEFFETPAK